MPSTRAATGESEQVNYFASDAYSAALIGWELCTYAKVGRYTSVRGEFEKVAMMHHTTEGRQTIDMSKLGSEEAKLLTSILTYQVARRPDAREICQSLETMIGDEAE